MATQVVPYADGPTAEVSVEIEASADAVWQLVTDPTLPARFSPELQEAGWDPDGPAPGPGARIIGHNRHEAVGTWTTTSHVTSWSEGREFSWSVGDVDRPAARWWFLLDPVDGNARVTLTQRVRLGPGPSGLTPAIERLPDRELDIVTRRLQEHETSMTANLQAIKAAAEGRATIEELAAAAETSD